MSNLPDDSSFRLVVPTTSKVIANSWTALHAAHKPGSPSVLYRTQAQIQLWRASPFEDIGIKDLIRAPDTAGAVPGIVGD
jgi:hypothetical protein